MRRFGIGTMKYLGVIFLASLVSLGALASVSLKNGNWFVGYTDIIYPGGFEPKIERVYNSKTPFRGMFGWGWGNEYEVYLTVSADGSVVVHEYGGGAENRFSPKAFNESELNEAVEKIAATMQKTGGFGSADQLASYKKKLRSDADFRNSEWEKFRGKNQLQPRALKEGTELVSNKFTYQRVQKVAGGYVRHFDTGRQEKFDEQGRLVRIADKNNNFIDITRTKDGSRIAKIQDNFNRRMFFTYNTKGLVEKIEGENGKVAAYKYDSKDALLESKDVDGNVYTFKYDARFNMTEIGYSDKTTVKIAYHDRSKNDNVKSVKDRDETATYYGYDTDSSDPGHYWVSVDVKDRGGKAISSSKYEYFMKRKADGEEWQYKMVTVVDGDRTETTYNECCGMPLLIKRGKEETSFEYDTKGRVTKKATPTDVTELTYNQTVGKVEKVVRYSKLDKKQAHWSNFQYDGKGNLVLAKNSENKGVKLFYDQNGRIKTMIDQSQRRIDFKYNENSKPIEITDPKLGTIKVSYTNSGEIKKVESSAGRKIALQVTSAFQNLLDIIRPAGVTLGF